MKLKLSIETDPKEKFVIIVCSTIVLFILKILQVN